MIYASTTITMGIVVMLSVVVAVGVAVMEAASVLLQGLSSALDLELTSYPNVFIFRKDFKFCSTFSNLKELLLNEWCLKPEFDALVYFLRYSPVMEKLTIQLENCWVQPSDDMMSLK
ncbi:hypothetical protein SEVIR_8G073632v4 [Setaria viridis]|uniref:FBD domain-containing protein n=1 Tax=Setaria viridis TaxID=4556 RepID=A0A4U6TCS2_SETVI|nr:hypothetical protein SEVIR_8G073632v2 [Setaria viridis]